MTSNPLSFILVRVICISWRNIYLNPLPIFKLDFWVFKLLSCRSSLYTLDASLLSDTWIANIFSLILWIIFFLFFRIFIDYAIIVVPCPPLHSTPSCLPPSHIPLESSCPWVIHISSLASTSPILFLPSPCLFSTYHLGYLFSVPFPLLSPSHSPVDNPPCELHFCDSVPVLVVFSSFLFFGLVVDSCEFIVILLFIFLIFFFFLDKSL